MNLRKELGLRIKELRKHKGLSQEKLSEMADIGQNTLSYIETGVNFCTGDTLEKIVRAFDIEPQELFNFGHLDSEENLLEKINLMLRDNPDKIREAYKIIHAIVY